ncbi:MAG: hypothetical protein KAS84_07510, partial [Anaerolineales bacterium]|nr:hypothetical protein [Anaerolineales bacterium]
EIAKVFHLLQIGFSQSITKSLYLTRWGKDFKLQTTSKYSLPGLEIKFSEKTPAVSGKSFFVISSLMEMV